MKIVRVPVRFSLLGGGSDLPAFFEHYEPSQIISMALGYYNYITYNTSMPYLNDTWHYEIQTPNTKQRCVLASEIENPLIRIALLETVHDRKLKHVINSWSDVNTNGVGLGGSSSFAVGLAALFNKFRESDGWILASAIDWEIDKLGADIGYQDHIIAVAGGFQYFTIEPNTRISFRSLDNGDFIAEHLLMFSLKSARTVSGNDVCNHDLLTDMKDSMVMRSIPIRKTLQLIPYMLNAIQEKNIPEIGHILNEAWILKLESHKGSDDLVNLYNIGIESGAYGGKVSGSLSKGCGHLFFIAPRQNHDKIINNLSPYCNYRPVTMARTGVTMREL